MLLVHVHTQRSGVLFFCVLTQKTKQKSRENPRWPTRNSTCFKNSIPPWFCDLFDPAVPAVDCQHQWPWRTLKVSTQSWKGRWILSFRWDDTFLNKPKGSPTIWQMVVNYQLDDGCQIWVVATQILFVVTPKIGEDEPILTHIFQLGGSPSFLFNTMSGHNTISEHNAMSEHR